MSREEFDPDDEAEEICLPIDAPRLDPGSPEARASGCTCDPAENDYGKGRTLPDGRGRAFRPNDDCPMHGLEAIAKLLRNEG